MDKIKNEIPENVRLRLDDTYKKILENECRNVEFKKSNSSKKIVVGVSGLVASFILIVVVGMKNPSLADEIPILKDFISKLQFALNNDVNLKENISNINKSSYVNGLNITIDKAMYDGNNVYADFILKTDKPFDETEYIKCLDDGSTMDNKKVFSFYFPEFKLNNKKPDGYSYEMPKVEFIDDYTLKGSVVFEFSAISEIESDTIDFEMDLKLCSYKTDSKGNSEILDGVWSFDFPIKSNKEDAKVVRVNKQKGDFKLNQVMLNKTSITIDIEAPNEYYKTFDIMEAVEVIDDNGNILWAKSGNYHNGNNEDKYPRYRQRYDLEEIGESLKYVKVKFYGKWDEKTKSAPVLAEFKVDLNNID